MATRLCTYLKSSIIKKQMMGVTGLLLCGFLISHLAGNFLIFVSPAAFNSYSHALISNPFIYLAEGILLLIFLTHIGLAIKLTIENNVARPEKYTFKKKSGRGANFASSTMPYTGIIILAFLIWHITGLKYGTYYSTVHNGVEMRDLYRLIVEYFSNKLNVLGYIFGMLCMGLHVSHGFWSAFQSIGFNHPKYNCCIKGVSTLFAFVVTIGFSALPIYCFIQGGK